MICQLMEKATIGLHTMVDEHFGITLVEFQVRGLRFSQHDRYRRLGGRLTGSLCWIFRLPASSLLHMLRLGH